VCQSASDSGATGQAGRLVNNLCAQTPFLRQDFAQTHQHLFLGNADPILLQVLFRTKKYISIDDRLDTALASYPLIFWIGGFFLSKLLRNAIIDEIADISFVPKKVAYDVITPRPPGSSWYVQLNGWL